MSIFNLKHIPVFIRDLFDTLFKGNAQGTLVQLFRYFIVGGTAFVVDYSVLYVLTEFAGFHYLLSATISFILGLITNYVISISWVFNNSKLSKRWLEFLVYTIIGIVGLALNALIMYVITDILSIHYMFSKIVSAMIVFFWNFFARKFILFKVK